MGVYPEGRTFTPHPWQCQNSAIEERTEERGKEKYLGRYEPDHPHPKGDINLVVVKAGYAFTYHRAKPYK
jgi:hypothetical protein